MAVRQVDIWHAFCDGSGKPHGLCGSVLTWPGDIAPRPFESEHSAYEAVNEEPGWTWDKDGISCPRCNALKIEWALQTNS